ncbi:MAG: DNA polymerase I [Anaerolineales bacterium]|nr:DNA polymerase I [Anaerolineales bacterium]
MTSRPRLYLIDGHALAYRTYYALTGAGGGSRFTTKAGEPTAGIYGFVSVLLRLLTEERPEYLAVCFDTGRTFRDDIYPEYKATREKMPEDLRPQLERIRQIVQAFGIPIYEKDGFEADDVLGAMANQASKLGAHSVILTGDRDLLQLADDHITIRLAGQKLSEAIDYDPNQVEEKYGIRPSQIIDYKAMVGDSSDNIPGVRGIGKKTARNLLNQYDTLDGIYDHLDEIQTRFRNKLEEGRDEAYLSQQLAAIVTDLDLDFGLDDCQASLYDRDQVVELFRELEFRTLLPRIPDAATDDEGRQLPLFTESTAISPTAGAEDKIICDAESLEELIQRLNDSDQIAFDVETTSTNAMQADLVGISLAVNPLEGFYIPVGHYKETAGCEQLDLNHVLEALRTPLTNPKIDKVGHNLKYDYILLARSGLSATPLSFDTMIAEWLCDPGSRNLGLKDLAWVRLGIEMTKIEELIGRGRTQRSMAEVPVAEVAPYAGADARISLSLMPDLQRELDEKEQTGLFQELEMALIPIFAHMEMAGILLDTKFMARFSDELTQRLNEIESQIYDQVGHSFNINSTQQLSNVLFTELQLTPPDRTRRTASGHYSTAATVLETMRKDHPIIELILEQREIGKLKSTYAIALPDQVNDKTGRIHTSYNQTGSVTGRIASSDPNLQNIPIRTELGRRIRKGFVASPGNMLLGVDYSQIELRVVAHMADDQAMIKAFQADQDIHTTTAAAIYNVKLDDVTPDMRRQAKAVNFGLIYGMSPFGLTRSTDLTLAEAEEFVKTYFKQFPGVRGYLDRIRLQAAEYGYVETLLGRRRYFPQLRKGGIPVTEPARARAEREAVNAPIQGTAADIIKLAMLEIPTSLRENNLQAEMLLQVHDELVFECPIDELHETSRIVQKDMQNSFSLKVPLKTDAKAGTNWAEMESIE